MDQYNALAVTSQDVWGWLKGKLTVFNLSLWQCSLLGISLRLIYYAIKDSNHMEKPHFGDVTVFVGFRNQPTEHL